MADSTLVCWLTARQIITYETVATVLECTESGTVVTSPEKDEKRDGSSAEKDDIVLTIA